MNIGIFSDTYFPQLNGVATSIRTLTHALREKGHTVYIFTPSDPRCEGQPEDEDIFRLPITEKLVEAGIRVALDDDNQKIGYKIRAAQQVDRVPYMLVLGAKEAEAGNVSVRDRKGETTTMEVDEFIAKVTSEIKNRSL